MDPTEKVVYSLRLHPQIKDSLQAHFNSMGSDLATGLRKIISDYFSEVVAPAADPGGVPRNAMTAGAEAGARRDFLQSVASAVAASARTVLPDVASVSLGSVLRITFGEYVRSLPPLPVLVAFLSNPVRSETVMVELAPAFRRILGIDEKPDETPAVRAAVEHLLQIEVPGRSGQRPSQLEVMSIETDLDYCRFTSFLEPVLQQTAQVSTKRGPLTISITLPLRAHHVVGG